MIERIVESVHIEKTAGTSMAKFFESALGRDHVAFYDPTTDSLTRSSDLLLPQSSRLVDVFKLRFQPFWPALKDLWIARQKKEDRELTIPEGIMVIHGHFRADRFDGINPNPLRAVLIREPLERMQSQYAHWKKTKGLAEWRVRTTFDDSLPFEEYAMLPELQNYQAQALAGKDLSQFEIVGVTENMQAYGRAMMDAFVQEGFCRRDNALSIGFINRTPQKARSAISELTSDFREAFTQFHSKDYELYKEAIERARN